MTAPVDTRLGAERADCSGVREGDAGRSREASLRRLAWQRAMERANLESWFRDPAAGAGAGELSGGAPAADAAERPPSRLARAVPLASCAVSVAARRPSASGPPPRASGAAGSLAGPRDRSSAASIAPAREAPPSRAAPLAFALEAPRGPRRPEAAASAIAPLRPRAGGDDRERLRMHAEWKDDGLRVWIGADRDPSAPLDRLVVPLLGQLHRWAEARGSRLAALVCNGHTVWERRRAEALPPRPEARADSAVAPRPAVRGRRELSESSRHVFYEEEIP